MNKKVKFKWLNPVDEDDNPYDIVTNYVYDKWTKAGGIFDGKRLTYFESFEYFDIIFASSGPDRYIELDEELFTFILLEYNPNEEIEEDY